MTEGEGGHDGKRDCGDDGGGRRMTEGECGDDGGGRRMTEGERVNDGTEECGRGLHSGEVYLGLKAVESTRLEAESRRSYRL